MCWKVQCSKCQLYTWAGCGQHQEQVMSKIPVDQRCICNKKKIDDDENKEIISKINNNESSVKQISSSNNNNTDTKNGNNENQLTLVCELTGHSERVWFCAWSPDKRILATTSGDKTIKLWCHSQKNNNISFKCIQTLDAHTRTVRSVSWHPTGNMFASASFDGTIGIWKKTEKNADLHLSDKSTSFYATNEIEFECIDLLEGHDNECKSLSWDCSGRLLASCSRDKSVWIWELDDTEDGNDEFEVAAVKRSHDGDVKCVKWHPFEELLVSSSYDDTIKSYKCDRNEDDWYINQVLKSHKSTVWSLCFNPLNGNEFVSCSDDKTLCIWKKMKIADENHIDYSMTNDANINDEDLAYQLKQRIEDVHDEAIYCVDWLCDKKNGINVIATCSGDNSIKFLHETQSEWKIFLNIDNAHNNDINCIQFGYKIKDGQYLIATASDDCTIKIWKLQTKLNQFKFDKNDTDYDDIVNEID